MLVVKGHLLEEEQEEKEEEEQRGNKVANIVVSPRRARLNRREAYKTRENRSFTRNHRLREGVPGEGDYCYCCHRIITR